MWRVDELHIKEEVELFSGEIEPRSEKVITYTMDDPIVSIIGKENILLQFTSLKDSKGKEIFEGDVVKFDDKTGYVEYLGEEARYIIDEWQEGETESIGHDLSSLPESVEIIGNIYENPELIKKSL